MDVGWNFVADFVHSYRITRQGTYFHYTPQSVLAIRWLRFSYWICRAFANDNCCLQLHSAMPCCDPGCLLIKLTVHMMTLSYHSQAHCYRCNAGASRRQLLCLQNWKTFQFWQIEWLRVIIQWTFRSSCLWIMEGLPVKRTWWSFWPLISRVSQSWLLNQMALGYCRLPEDPLLMNFVIHLKHYWCRIGQLYCSEWLLYLLKSPAKWLCKIYCFVFN